MKQVLQSPDVVCEEYDPEFACITIQELRYLLHRCGRYTPYWMYFVLRASTGMRPGEAMNITLYHLSPDCTTINYRVAKPRTTRKDEVVERHKHRRIVLDPWVAQQLKVYLDRTCRIVNGVYVSPLPYQRIFPWNSIALIDTYWYKLRHKMKAAGFDSMRLEREYHRQKTQTRDKTYILRPHILRHFAASVMVYKLGNITSVRDWIKHEKTETTNGYLHSAESLGTTPEYLQKASWAEILGYDQDQTILPASQATDQTSIDMY